MSISFDTNSCSGITTEETRTFKGKTKEVIKKQGNPRPMWWRKNCPKCNANHGNRKIQCECGHMFIDRTIVKPTKSGDEMLREASNQPKTIILPTVTKQKSRVSLIHARLASYYSLVAAAHKELSEIS